MQKLSEGCKNILYCCYLDEDKEGQDALLVRIQYDETKEKSSEELALRLADITGCGKQLLASFNNGLVVGYARGRMITWNDLWDPHIAK